MSKLFLRKFSIINNPVLYTGGRGAGGRGNNAITIAANFVEFRRKYARYHKKFAMFEALNIVSVFLSMLVTHWILNYKFWNYGMDVIEYVSYYGQIQGRKLHDPMCELFPTEVACNINIGSTTGALDRTNFLCILGNNLFNQKYFFILWLWWMFLLVLSVLGLVYRTARISVPSLSRYLLSRKVHGKSLQQLERLRLNSGDCFVLEVGKLTPCMIYLANLLLKSGRLTWGKLPPFRTG